MPEINYTYTGMKKFLEETKAKLHKYREHMDDGPCPCPDIALQCWQEGRVEGLTESIENQLAQCLKEIEVMQVKYGQK